MTTPTQSLSERLRTHVNYLPPEDLYREAWVSLLHEAADALDAKDELIKRQSAEIGRLVAVTLHCGAQEAEVERLRAALQRIDGINDSPACFNPMIEEVLRRVLEPTP